MFKRSYSSPCCTDR